MNENEKIGYYYELLQLDYLVDEELKSEVDKYIFSIVEKTGKDIFHHGEIEIRNFITNKKEE